jgi:hypothetical protein
MHSRIHRAALKSDAQPPVITVAQRPGRLGNLLLQYTNLIAFAEEHQATILNPSFFDYNHYFLGTHKDFLSRYPSHNSLNLPRPLRVCFYKLLRFADQSGILANLPGSTFIDLPIHDDYHLDSPEFLDLFHHSKHIFLRRTWRSIYRLKNRHHIEKARTFFQLVPHRARRVQNFIDQVKSRSDILIGVHIRQTDFRDHRGGKYYFTTPQYAALMAKTAALFLNQAVAFVICSDSPQSPENFPSLKTHFPEPEHVEDLFILASCDYIIGPAISSYCAIASMFGSKPRLSLESSEQTLRKEDFQIWGGD